MELDLKQFSISSVNLSKPSARSQNLNLRAGKAYDVKLEGSDSDGDAVSFRIISEPKYGKLSGTIPNLTFTFSDLDISAPSVNTFTVLIFGVIWANNEKLIIKVNSVNLVLIVQ